VSEQILYVEKSVHVLFDGTNPLNKKDAHVEDFKLGLVRKVCCLCMRKVSVLKRDKGLQLFLQKMGKV